MSLIDFSVHAQHITSTLEAGTYDAVVLAWASPRNQHRHRSGILPQQPSAQCHGSAGMFGRGRPGIFVIRRKICPRNRHAIARTGFYHCGIDASYRTVTLELPEPRSSC